MSGAPFIQATFLILAFHAHLERRGLCKRQAEPPLAINAH